MDSPYLTSPPDAGSVQGQRLEQPLSASPSPLVSVTELSVPAVMNTRNGTRITDNNRLPRSAPVQHSIPIRGTARKGFRRNPGAFFVSKKYFVSGEKNP